MASTGPGPQFVLTFPATNTFNRYIVPENTVLILTRNTPGYLYAQAYSYNGSTFSPMGNSVSIYYYAGIPQAWLGGLAGDYIVYSDGTTSYSLAFKQAYENPENIITEVATDSDLVNWIPPSTAVLAKPFPSAQIIEAYYGGINALIVNPSNGTFPYGTPLVLYSRGIGYVVNGNGVTAGTMIPPAGTLTISSPNSNATNYSVYNLTISP